MLANTLAARTDTEAYVPPRRRRNRQALEGQLASLAGAASLPSLLAAWPKPSAVINDARQIVLANARFAALAGTPADELRGKRFGEAVGCGYADAAPDGCGTTPACRFCGVAAGLATMDRGDHYGTECHIRTRGRSLADALDLRVYTERLVIGGTSWSLLVAEDISDEKRRAVLERLLYGEVLNAAGSVQSALRLLPQLSPDAARQLALDTAPFGDELVERIQAQRDLMLAEAGELRLSLRTVDLAELLSALSSRFAFRAVAAGKRLLLHGVDQPERACVRTDPLLLGRALAHLIENAFEATPVGEAVTVTLRPHPMPVFEISNPTVMAERVRRQIFHRSFTTSGVQGRGLGTYAAKLLVEGYLGGSVECCSTHESGTVFRVRLPQMLVN